MTEFYSCTTFRFLNSADSKNCERDEILRLWYNGTTYLWVYTYECKNKRHIMEFSTKQELYAYLKSYFTLLSYDVEPYYSMQLLLPGLPSIMLAMKDILPTFSNIENLLELTFNHGPKIVHVDTAKKYIQMYEKVNHCSLDFNDDAFET